MRQSGFPAAPITAKTLVRARKEEVQLDDIKISWDDAFLRGLWDLIRKRELPEGNLVVTDSNDLNARKSEQGNSRSVEPLRSEVLVRGNPCSEPVLEVWVDLSRPPLGLAQ